MSTRRKGSVPLYAAQNGYKHCRANKLCVECGGNLTGRRISWCSDKCVETYRLRSDPGFARSVVFKRDNGICAICNLDTRYPQKARRHALEASQHEWESLNERNAGFNRGRPIKLGSHYCYIPPGLMAIVERRVKAALAPWRMETWWKRHTFWDHDHIKLVTDGGGECDLSNLRTLCVRCHAGRSAAHNGGRGWRRPKAMKSLRQRKLGE